MKYKVLWLIAAAAIFLDAGITLVAIQSSEIHEANPNTANMMAEYGEVPAMIMSMLIRLCAIGFGIALQHAFDYAEWLVPAILVPVAIAPVPWNIYIITKAFIFA